MAKFSRDRFPPDFFDLPQSAGETLPVEIIDKWTHSAQTREVAGEILAPHTIRGVIVSSDSAGLTRLTRDLPLVEILAMVSAPKEIIHSLGTAIGGRDIGRWVADNTEMFYEASIEPNRVVAMLRTTLERIGKECEVAVGMAAHTGSFFELGGAVYGPDADRVETVAESYTEGGELVITDDLVRALGDGHGFSLQARAELQAEFGGILRVTSGPTIDGLQGSDHHFPSPFTEEFSDELMTYSHTRRETEAPRHAFQEVAVVLILREREDPDVPEVAVLNDLALTAAMKRIGNALLRDIDGEEIKNSGLIGIYTFPRCSDAVEFARRIRHALAEQQIQCRIGIDAGPVLIFDLGQDTREIAGSAVNVASKLAEDLGAFGKIQISDEVARQAGEGRQRPALAYRVSGVELHAYEI